MTDFKVILPFPSSSLNPNGRNHYHALARAKKAYRADCRMLTISERNKTGFDAEPRPKVVITFNPPDYRPRDRDNMIAAFKSGQDGVADAIGVDDYHWITTYEFEEPVKRGRVSVRFVGGE